MQNVGYDCLEDRAALTIINNSIAEGAKLNCIQPAGFRLRVFRIGCSRARHSLPVFRDQRSLQPSWPALWGKDQIVVLWGHRHLW